MIINTFQKYWGKGRILRHYTQHLIISFIYYLFLNLSLGIPLKPGLLLIFFISTTFLPDLDPLLYFIINKNNYPILRDRITEALKAKQYKKAAEVGVQNHKQFNRLYIHNIVFFLPFSIIYLYLLIMFRNNVITMIFSGLWIHFIFDILDDIKQVKNIDNWLWPIKNNL